MADSNPSHRRRALGEIKAHAVNTLANLHETRKVKP